jgi:predicted TIM-barrel fold metal-dependent hydrolase
VVGRFVNHLKSDDILLYSSDYPHWQFDGDQVMPLGLPEALRQRIMVDNPLSTYTRLQEVAQ